VAHFVRQKAEFAMQSQSAPGAGDRPVAPSWAYADELPDDVAGALVATATVTASGAMGDVEITWDPAVSPTAHGLTDAALDQPDEQVALITTASRVRADADGRTRAAAVAVAHQVQQGMILRAVLQSLEVR
jgi:hypothetical protein